MSMSLNLDGCSPAASIELSQTLKPWSAPVFKYASQHSSNTSQGMPSVRNLMELEAHVQGVIAQAASRCSDNKHQPCTAVQSRTAATAATSSKKHTQAHSELSRTGSNTVQIGRRILKHTQN